MKKLSVILLGLILSSSLTFAQETPEQTPTTPEAGAGGDPVIKGGYNKYSVRAVHADICGPTNSLSLNKTDIFCYLPMIILG